MELLQNELSKNFEIFRTGKSWSPKRKLRYIQNFWMLFSITYWVYNGSNISPFRPRFSEMLHSIELQIFFTTEHCLAWVLFFGVIISFVPPVKHSKYCSHCKKRLFLSRNNFCKSYEKWSEQLFWKKKSTHSEQCLVYEKKVSTRSMYQVWEEVICYNAYTYLGGCAKFQTFTSYKFFLLLEPVINT